MSQVLFGQTMWPGAKLKSQYFMLWAKIATRSLSCSSPSNPSASSLTIVDMIPRERSNRQGDQTDGGGGGGGISPTVYTGPETLPRTGNFPVSVRGLERR